MALAFPSGPSIGDEFTGGGFTWTWNGGAWTKLAASGSTSGEDFILDVGTSGNTTFEFDSDLAAGQYSITSQLNDTSLEIFLVASDDTSAGYTTTSSITATKAFNRVVVYGMTTSDSISFAYQKAASPAASGNVGGGVPPFVTNVETSTLPNAGDTTVVNGGNFASNVEVVFVDSSNNEYPASSLVRVSSSQLVVGRPDDMINTAGPYDVKVTNPGFVSSIVSNVIANSVSTGVGPQWSTAPVLPIYALNAAYSQSVAATDSDGSEITYSIVSGELPSGLSLNSSTGEISGTPTAHPASGDVIIRATDGGGNYLDKTFTMTDKVVVSGGTLYEDTNYYYRKFTSTQTLSVGGTSLSYDTLMVGGGGNGGGAGFGGQSGQRGGGGGGGGGVLQVNSQSLNAGDHTVYVGGTGGGQSKIGADATQIAYGGGNGGSSGGNGGDGASGGGGAGANVPYYSYNGAGGQAIYGAQGNNGGGGGGGSGGSGGGLSTTAYNTSWLTKVSGPSQLGSPGTGGRGNGWPGSIAGSTGAGGANSGAGGGGAANYDASSGVGGTGAQAGIVIIRYAK